MVLTLFVLLFCSLSSRTSAVRYAEYILTPSSRTIYPVSVYNINGTVKNAAGLVNAKAAATFTGPSAATYDFGKNVAGIVSFDFNGSTDARDVYIGVSFTESSLWISSEGCDATADAGIDQTLWFEVSGTGHRQASEEHQRGGFRYLNVYHNSTTNVTLTNLSVYFTAVPQKTEADLQAYTGYFHTSDEQLNRVWYAGAYTNELCTIEPTAGDALNHLGAINSSSTINSPLPWYLNYTIASGASVLVDGAKRDRLVWPGDMSIAVPSIFVSANDLPTVRNSLDSLLRLQNSSTGALPYAGMPFGQEMPVFSFTYHLYSLIGIYDYYLYSGDEAYLARNWERFKFGLNYSISFIDSSGMANVTTSADWLRFGMGGHNIEANAILYRTLNLGTTLADIMNDSTVSAWSRYAARIKNATMVQLWDPVANLYRDNDTLPLTKLHPQDGNAWAVVSNLTGSFEQNINISKALAARWGPYGAPAPEAGATVSPFISGFELQAHYLAGQANNAVRLMKLMWGDFMLDDPRMTNSTFIEGYSTNGDLHYAPYTNDARISHAHGWATGPTSALTFYAAGLQVTSAAGKTWKISPMLGGLTFAEAGFRTPLGLFEVNVTALENGGMNVTFHTPVSTTGSVIFAHETDARGEIRVSKVVGGAHLVKRTVIAPGGPSTTEIHGLQGGSYEASLNLH
ncbi:uncharacterized protein Z519_06966 [Cladophialophora bantiana CBS 173.52]|uniref:Alpha-L-rhamnosidase six-hairpin glycosidase domain-containing protein n=1 Tax=Cladophialophora bantiana (strain ATCC 10958 / CBS 173.52 / CDC B-1940 / NIH 8579) TaxID=1442370 RepID=A0A0D2I555_CLAB1|nr:uncharacterized protein Z519_06966 [Cladophialophora bantiana CBS 173.52]KIW91984.1 hypothetical protein Z519_06966 [Cladophialophora bantiana CBS 173.52]